MVSLRRMMRSTVVTKDDLGTIVHIQVLKPGDEQLFVFEDKKTCLLFFSPNAPACKVTKAG